MNKEVYEWFNDGHKVIVCIEGDSTHLQVLCPGAGPGKHPGLKCGMADHDDGEPMGPFCWVTEMMAEIGLEGHCTAVGIMARGEIPIEWGYFDDGEFFFKCAGYPSWQEAKTFRNEAMDDLFEGETQARAETIAKAVALFPLQPWSETDEELKEQTREDIQTYIENEERKANA